MNELLSFEFMRPVIDLIFQVLVVIFSVLFWPINVIIYGLLPNAGQFFSQVYAFFDMVTTYFAYALNALALTPLARVLLVASIVTVIMIKYLSWPLKTVIKWIFHR